MILLNKSHKKLSGVNIRSNKIPTLINAVGVANRDIAKAKPKSNTTAKGENALINPSSIAPGKLTILIKGFISSLKRTITPQAIAEMPAKAAMLAPAKNHPTKGMLINKVGIIFMRINRPIIRQLEARLFLKMSFKIIKRISHFAVLSMTERKRLKSPAIKA